MKWNKPLLIIDDDPVEQIQIKRLLAKQAFDGEVITFEKAEAAMHWLTQCSETTLPYLVLLDLHLPGLSGIEFIRWIKTDQESLKNLPLAVLSTSNSETDRAKVRQLGVNHYLVKGMDPEKYQQELSALLHHLLGLPTH
jgi:CheY-like chemotaxis protein